MILTVLAACIVAAAAWQEPRKCCVDHQFSATMTIYGGQADVASGQGIAIEGYSYLGYDYYNHKLGTVTYMKDQTTGNYTMTMTLNDYRNMKTYVRKEDGGACTATPMDPEETIREPCLPMDATYLGNGTLGYGDNSIMVHAWEYMEDENVRTRFSFTESCVPVLMAQDGVFDGNPGQMNYWFTAFHPGISDPNSLMVPTDCVDVNPDAGVPVGRR